MEELQSTEVLDREILEDARKKAANILQSAEETLKTQAEVWELKSARVIGEIRRGWEERTGATKAELEARLPLDKRRLKLERVQALMKTAMASYLSGLSRPVLLSLLERELAMRVQALTQTGEAGALTGSTVKVAVNGLSDEEAEAVLRKCLPASASWERVSPPSTGAEDPFPALSLDTPELRLTASVTGKGEELLRDKRLELATALLGPEFGE